jgi:hypothetical protein
MASCLLAAFGPDEPSEDVGPEARAYVGALRLLEALEDLRLIRMVLTKPAP